MNGTLDSNPNSQFVLSLRWLHDLTQLQEEGKKLSDKVANSNS